MAATIEVVVVYEQQEYYVDAMVESHGSEPATTTSMLSLELLQFQLFSLVGVAPNEQTLLSSRGELLVTGAAAQQQLTVRADDEHRTRLFLLARASQDDDITAAVGATALPDDWQQICSKSAFGDVPTVQPAFCTTSSSGSPSLICQACAQTCTTFTPFDWHSSEPISAQFISELAVVAGDVDVPAPPGFHKLPGDLNHSAPGDHVFVCVKRSGHRALTELLVHYEHDGGTNSPASGSAPPPSRHCSVDCNSGNRSATRVRLSTHSVFRETTEEFATLAITDIRVVIGSAQRAPSRAHIQIPRSLNAGVRGAEPIHLWYALAPLGGFVCDARDGHSALGECLFAMRHAHAVTALRDFDVRRVQAAQTAAAQRSALDDAALRTQYAPGQRAMTARLTGTLARVQSYESAAMQHAALQCIPVATLRERARAALDAHTATVTATPVRSFDDELLAQLLHWFKREFFTWMNAPPCVACSSSATQCVATESPNTPEEVRGDASRVEVYACTACHARTRFPRYNDPVTLLTTRTGRCGEWANCFTLCCRAMGFEARYVLDVTDHVWTEVYSHAAQRWLHCDACEDQLDGPLTYEVGWGKRLSYIISVAHDHVVDSARRYTVDWDAMRARRRDVSESWLAATIAQMNAQLQRTLPPARVELLHARASAERIELARGGRTASGDEVQGRVSGSAEWKSQRSEDGTQREATAVAAASSGYEATDAVQQSSVPAAAATAATQVVELSQRLCRNLLLGCSDDACVNAFCQRWRNDTTASSDEDATDRAARALQLVASFNQRGFSAESLASLLCPLQPRELRACVLARRPLLYLPLQDGEPLSGDATGWLVDASGHNHHVANTASAPVRKPFVIPHSGTSSSAAAPATRRSFGVQLLPGQRLATTFARPANGSYALSLLMRIDASGNGDASSATAADNDVLTLALGSHTSITLCAASASAPQHELVCEVRATSGAASTLLAASAIPRALLAFGAYAHVGVAFTPEAITVFVNAVSVVTVTERVAPVSDSGDCESLVLLGAERAGIASAVISHVCVLELDDVTNGFAAFCATMKQQFVRTPPLRAFRADGECSDARCAVDAATAQTEYRVARVHMWGGEFFDGVQFVYEAVGGSGSGALVFGPLLGNANASDAAASPTTQLALLPGEVVTSVSGRKGAWTDSLRLETSYGRTVACGGRGGGDFHLVLPSSSEVRALEFAVGDHLADPIAFVGSESAAAREATDRESLEELRVALRGSDSAQSRSAVAAALKYLDNLSKQPRDAKFHRILATNAFFAKNIAALGADACCAFMRWCGFAPLTADGENDGGKSFFVLVTPSDAVSGDRCSAEDAARATERLVAETHRRMHLLKRFSGV